MALRALVEPLAGISRHGLYFGVAAMGTGKRRFQNNGIHFELAASVDG